VKQNYQTLIASTSIDTTRISAYQQAEKKEVTQILLAKKSEKKEKSYLGKFGHFIEPVIRPLGFDWRIGISIISGIPAKEIIVSSLAVLYQVDESDSESSHTLVDRLKNAKYQSGPNVGKNVFNPAVALAFMIFVLLYIPCIGTISAIKQETGSWKWGLFSVVYSFTLAWVFAFIANNIIRLFL
jgi:ferrous iron transport protein B